MPRFRGFGWSVLTLLSLVQNRIQVKDLFFQSLFSIDN